MSRAVHMFSFTHESMLIARHALNLHTPLKIMRRDTFEQVLYDEFSIIKSANGIAVGVEINDT